MRKTIKLLSALLFSTVTTGSIIACANPFADPNVFRIAIVTDGHTITDQSFNESSYNGAKKFKSDFEKWITSGSAPEEFQNKKIEITPIQPPTTDLNTFIQSYGQAVVMNSKVTVASGFIQNSALVAAQNGILKGKMRYIYVDGDTPTPAVSKENKNLAGLLYKAEQSGFLAAIAGGVWLIANADQYGGYNNLSVSTYGGLDIPAVTSYMYGFLWGIELLNKHETYSNTLDSQLRDLVKTLNPNFADSTSWPTINFIELPNQFTGSFDQASVSSKSLNDSLVNKGANIIFPVAGPQTSDTLSAIQSKASKGKVIGVDTDQALQYKSSANYFLTSALKNIVDSVSDTIWQALGLNPDANTNHQALTPEEIDAIFKGNAQSQGGKSFVGIADNQAIHPIYQDVNSNSELASFAEQVSTGWEKVAANKDDFWNYGKNLNPFVLRYI